MLAVRKVSLVLGVCLGVATALAGTGATAADKPDAPGKTAKDAQVLFDGKSLDGWKVTEFVAAGDVSVDKSFRGGPAIVVKSGESLSGFNWTGELPKTNYEISLEAMKINGLDFMCGLTFPVGDSFASLILGGWGGETTGISSIDRKDASENETTKYIQYAKDHWYHVRLRVTPKKLQAWLDDKPIVDQDITGRMISLRPGAISMQKPLGICTYQTTSAFRAIRLRKLPE